MTKIQDISERERWPMLSQIFPMLASAFALFFLYQGIVGITGSWDWPLAMVKPPNIESYEAYVESSRIIFRWFVGPFCVGVSCFLLFTLIAYKRKREEVETEK